MMSRNNIPHDALSPEGHQLLAVASLFEGPFSIDWIQALTQLKASQILLGLEKAAKQGILKRGDIGSFSFSDEKKRRNAQNDLTPEDREHYYGFIAALLIEDLPDTPQKAEAVAAYLLNIANDPEGCHWLMKAATRYRTAFRTDLALRCYLKILDDLSGLPHGGADRLFCDAAIEYAKLNTARNDVKRVIALLEEAMVRAKNLQNRRYQALIDLNIAKNKWLQSQYKSALQHFENAWTLAGLSDDESLKRSVANFKTFLLYWQGLFTDAVLDYEKSMSDVEKFPYGRFPLLATMTVGTCYGQIGQVTQGIGMIDAIRRHCLETGDIGLAAHSSICIGAIMLDIGHIDDALQHLVPSVEEAKKMQPDWTTIQGELMLAYAHYLGGENDKAMRHIHEFHKLGKRVDVSVRPWPYLMELCWAAERDLLPAIPGTSIRQEIDAMISGENVFLKGVAYRFKALLDKREGLPHDQITAALERSVKYLTASGHAIELAKTRIEMVRLHLARGDQRRAMETAEMAYDVLSTLNEDLIPDDLKPLMARATGREIQFKEIVAVQKELSFMKSNKDAIQFIISTANRIMGAERGGVFLLEDKNPPYRFKLRASKNLSPDQTDLPEFISSLNLMADVAASGQGRVQDLRIQEKLDFPDEDVILSSICVPIVDRQRILGVLYHDNRLLSNAFDVSLLDLLTALASSVALILENDRLVKDCDALKEQVGVIKAHYERRNDVYKPADFENIVGESPEIKRILSQIGEIAKSDTTVLVLGETGVGKELVVEAILKNSLRRDKPFISLNCSALSEKLIYSELFGHEKGSFTGADHRHIGRFEKANRGTLFLDEIGDLPLDMQIRLLRVLETKAFERVGGKETIRSDFRLITATNRNLDQEVKKKTFRADLFYRINVFSIYIPPLREHRQDIPLLIAHFLKRQAEKTGKIARLIADEEMLELTRYNWPGNVRELKNCVERFVASPQTRITDLLDMKYRPVPMLRLSAVSLEENERRHIEWALERTYGKIHGPGGAAELLHIHPNTLSFRIKKLGIKRPESNRRTMA